MQSTLLAREPQADESPRIRNLAAPAALIAALAALGVALLAEATLSAVGLVVIAILLAVSAITGAYGHRGRLVTGGLAVVTSLVALGALVLPGGEPAAGAVTVGDAVQSDVADSPVAVTVGSMSTDATTKSTSVLVTVTNVTEQPVSTWASISATAPTGQEYAAQGVGVQDLEPGATSTQQIQFGAVLPEGAVFVVKDVL